MSDTEETTIPFETVRVPNGDKPKGYEEVISDGVDGKRIVTRNEDGQLVSERVTPAKNEVVYFGTKEEGEDGDTLSSGTAGDETISQSIEPVSTPEPPREQTEKETYQNGDTHKYEPLVSATDDSIQQQGRFSENKEIFNMNSVALKKAALEAARLVVFALPGILITVFTDNPSLGGSLGGTILLILKSLDRGIHESPATPVKGLLPF